MTKHKKIADLNPPQRQIVDVELRNLREYISDVECGARSVESFVVYAATRIENIKRAPTLRFGLEYR